jgi:amidophosphoribosyltransferase
MGEALGSEAPVHEPAFVIPIPDSGRHAALGYARSTGLAYQEAIERNTRAGRSFLKPTPVLRHEEAAQKYAVNSALVSGQRVVLVDDSLVRGTTLVPILELMREAGAAEIHLRIASPPLRYPDFYGVDLPNGDDLLAARYMQNEMQSLMGADSLAFLSLESVYRAFGYGRRDSHAPQLADHCFTGEYPRTQIERFKKVA